MGARSQRAERPSRPHDIGLGSVPLLRLWLNMVTPHCTASTHILDVGGERACARADHPGQAGSSAVTRDAAPLLASSTASPLVRRASSLS